MGNIPMVIPVLIQICTSQTPKIPNTTKPGKGVVGPLSHAHQAIQNIGQEQERERHAQEPQFLTDHAEYEVGVLLGKEVEAFLRALQEPLPGQAPAADGDLGLHQVVACTAWIHGRIQEDEQSILLVRPEGVPQRGGDRTGRHVGYENHCRLVQEQAVAVEVEDQKKDADVCRPDEGVEGQDEPKHRTHHEQEEQ